MIRQQDGLTLGRVCFIEGTILFYKGRNTIKQRNRDFIQFEIKDNGIGRVSAAKSAAISKGKGIHIIELLFELMNSKENGNMFFRISDLYDQNGISSGTSVVIDVPINVKKE